MCSALVWLLVEVCLGFLWDENRAEIVMWGCLCPPPNLLKSWFLSHYNRAKIREVSRGSPNSWELGKGILALSLPGEAPVLTQDPSQPPSPLCMFLLVPFAQGIKQYKLSRIFNSERRKKNPLGIIHSDFFPPVR